MTDWENFERFVNLDDRVVADDIMTETIIIGHQKFYRENGKIFLEPTNGSADSQQITLKEAKRRAIR